MFDIFEDYAFDKRVKITPQNQPLYALPDSNFLTPVFKSTSF